MYSFDGRIRYSECDETGRLSLFAAMNYLQDCSTFHSDCLGMGIDSLYSRNMAWVLADWSVEILRLPEFGERVTISTWCYGMTRAHALRNFLIAGEKGEHLVRADSQWFVFDVASGHATRVPEDQRAYMTGEPRLEMAPLTRRLRPEGEGVPAPVRTVLRHELDTNHHVNNAQYVRYALEALDSLGHDARPGRLEVQYRAMALLGSPVAPIVHEREDGWDVSITNGEGLAYALVRLTGREGAR